MEPANRGLQRYLYENVPVPRRTAYRRRKEAEIRERMRQEQDSDSDGGSVYSPSHDTGPAPYHSPLHAAEGSDESQYQSNHSHMSCASEASDNYDEATLQEDVSHSSETMMSDAEEASLEELSEDEGRGIHTPPPMHGPHQDNHRNRLLLGDQLCQCTTTTEGDALLMCLALGIRHGLSWAALVDILKFVNKLFGKKVVRDSKYYLMKYLEAGKEATSVHIYCPQCEAYLGTKESVTEENILICTNCQENVKPFSKSSSYFVSVKMNQQFQELMESPEVANKVMTYRFNRIKVNDEAYEDLYDGKMYKKWCEPGQILSEPQNLSVTINTDGLALGETSAQSAWPIFLHVNELPPKYRKKHMIYAGMWVGKKQPNMTIFLKTFVEDLNSLSQEGFAWKNSEGVVVRSKVIPLLAVLDSGARYKFLNLTSYSGYMGCTFCYQRAENTKKGRRFTVTLEPAPLRTQESMLADMQVAHGLQNLNDPQRRAHRGSKGFTPLVYLHPYLDLGAGVVVDFMHNALLGVCRSHVYSMLDKANTPYYIGSPENLAIMNERLMHIRPPQSIPRTPRELKHIKLYKASEWSCLLIFYGIILFNSVLGDKYADHFSMLSSAFAILLKNSITAEELELSKKYLRQYVYLSEEYFGKEAMTYNMHLLLHVIKSVTDWGPIWGYSTFDFEGENHFLSKMHTSSGRVALQLTRRYLTFRSYPKLCESMASSDEPISFIEDITGKKYTHFVRSEESILVGKCVEHMLTDEERECLRAAGIEYFDDVVDSFERMLFRKIRFTTQLYSEGKKNDDSWIKTSRGIRGFITNILNVRVAEEIFMPVILVREVVILRAPILSRTRLVRVLHIKKIESHGRLLAFKPNEIAGQCIYMVSENLRFLADIPYGCYGD